MEKKLKMHDEVISNVNWNQAKQIFFKSTKNLKLLLYPSLTELTEIHWHIISTRIPQEIISMNSFIRYTEKWLLFKQRLE